LSVSETYSIVVNGPDDGLTIAGRLAASNGALIRWAAFWTADLDMTCVSNPTMADVRHLVARAADDPLCIHWSPALYTSDVGPGAPWISYVDDRGIERDDARVYGIELAHNAIPLTTMSDRPGDEKLGYGPTPGAGWALHLRAIRDHMTEEQLRHWLATAASVPLASVQRVRAPDVPRATS